jgi:hypothetical protein
MKQETLPRHGHYESPHANAVGQRTAHERDRPNDPCEVGRSSGQSIRKLGNNGSEKVLTNKYWAEYVTRLLVKILDHTNKKQVALHGCSFMKLNIFDGTFFTQVVNPQAVLVDR